MIASFHVKKDAAEDPAPMTFYLSGFTDPE
jgi:hypothetical protein